MEQAKEDLKHGGLSIKRAVKISNLGNTRTSASVIVKTVSDAALMSL
jgi:hypothetical protein